VEIFLQAEEIEMSAVKLKNKNPEIFATLMYQTF
jgi:hypothetical protein